MSKKLLFSITKKDFKIDYFSGTGAGGQYRNKHQNCVRLHHLESGVIMTGQSNRERTANIREALNGLIKHPKFKVWHTRKIHEKLQGITLEEKVDEMMLPINLKIEGKDKSGKWAILADIMEEVE
jgi:protein subunit release factor A